MDELAALITRLATDRVTPTALPGVSVIRSEVETSPIAHVALPSLAFVVGGAKWATLADHRLRYGAGQYLIIGVALPIAGHICEASARDPFLAVGIDLDPAKIAALLLDAQPARPAADRVPLGLAVSDAPAALLSALTRLVALAETPEHAPALRPAYEREILWHLLVGPQGELVRQIGLADSRLAHVARAIRHLRERFAEPVRIEELAAVAAMSPSSLHRHFRAVTGMTPIAFQKQLRLQAARSQLFAQPGDVAGAGFAVGYESASQFSREYRRMFGVPPGRDAQARRATV